MVDNRQYLILKIMPYVHVLCLFYIILMLQRYIKIKSFKCYFICVVPLGPAHSLCERKNAKRDSKTVDVAMVKVDLTMDKRGSNMVKHDSTIVRVLPRITIILSSCYKLFWHFAKKAITRTILNYTAIINLLYTITLIIND